MRQEQKQKLTIKILTIVIVALVLVMAVVLFLIPAYQGNINDRQVEAYNVGVNDVYTNLLITVNQQGFVQIPLDNNQTLTLVPFVDPNAA